MSLQHRLAATYLPPAFERWLLRRPPHPRISVLMYHEVLPDEVGLPSWLIVKDSQFRQQMEYLSEHYDVLSLDEAVTLMSSQGARRDSGRPMAVITFDDGYAGNFHHALPILKSLGLPFTVYVATSRILRGGRYWYDDVICALLASNRARLRLDTSLGPLEYKLSGRTESARWTAVEHVLATLKSLPKGERRSLVDTLQAEALVPELRMMTPDELKTLSSDPLTTIGNHTHGHDLLDRIPSAQSERSIVEAQQHLKAWTSSQPGHFSYPNGNFTDEVAQQVASLGFRTAVTTESRQWTPADSQFHIPRIGIGRFDSMNLFRARISGLVN